MFELKIYTFQWQASHDGIITSCNFSCDGKYVISGGDLDFSVSVWDAKEGELIAKLKRKWTQIIVSAVAKLFSLVGTKSLNSQLKMKMVKNLQIDWEAETHRHTRPIDKILFLKKEIHFLFLVHCQMSLRKVIFKLTDCLNRKVLGCKNPLICWSKTLTKRVETERSEKGEHSCHEHPVEIYFRLWFEQVVEQIKKLYKCGNTKI